MFLTRIFLQLGAYDQLGWALQDGPSNAGHVIRHAPQLEAEAISG